MIRSPVRDLSRWNEAVDQFESPLAGFWIYQISHSCDNFLFKHVLLPC